MNATDKSPATTTLQAGPPSPSPRFNWPDSIVCLNEEELAEMVGISRKSLAQARNEGLLPYSALTPHTLVYTRADLEAWIERTRHNTGTLLKRG